jgi:N-acetyl-alpha-D-glucosaminyl L-malate synthase BshA
MKIGITCYPTSGGSGVVAAELGLALARRGHEVHFISYTEPFRFRRENERVFYHPVTIPNYPLFEYPSYGMAMASRMAEVSRVHGLDLLHVHYAYPHAVSGYLARQLLGPSAPRVVTTLHGTDITLVGAEPSLADLIRFAIEESDGATAVSGYLRSETADRLGVRRPIEVIPNFVDPEVFTPARRDPRRRREWAAPDEKLILHVSNYRPVKRVRDTVEAFARIHREVPARLLLAGTGPEVTDAVERAAALGVADRLHVAGEARDVQDLFAQADLLLQSSEREGFGLVCLEAMASGVPVVSTRCGGVEEVVEDGASALLAPVGDAAGLAGRAVRVLSDPLLARRMGEAGRRRAVERFHIDRVVPMYEAYYVRTAPARGARTAGAAR